MDPQLSAHFAARKSSPIRQAQILFSQRGDDVTPINVAIGNVSLPMHPGMIERLHNLKTMGPFQDGVVKYSSTKGFDETNRAVLNVIAASGFETKGLHSQITDGGSHGMELIVLGCCGKAGTGERPLMLIDAAYSNYSSMVRRVGRTFVSVSRTLSEEGKFELPDFSAIERTIQKDKPGAMVVIPYDNPTGQLFSHDALAQLARLCVKYGMWLVSDEAYRELHYDPSVERAVSVWGLTEQEVPGITGRRISLETASKVWNACGLRIGAVVTDNAQFSSKCIFENTANLCAPVIAQYIYGALANINHQDLQAWFKHQRSYYRPIADTLKAGFQKHLPGVILSSPEASLYSVADVRNIVAPGFSGVDFVRFCATTGQVQLPGHAKPLTLLVAPMSGFYNIEPNPGHTQMRIAFVESPSNMKLIPLLFTKLLDAFEKSRAQTKLLASKL